MTEFLISELRVGGLHPLGPIRVPSGIDKTPVSNPALAMVHGIEGDAQGDRRHHGGPDKAVHAYATANYPLWAADLPQQATLFRPGAFGENLVVDGATEADICLGDRWRAGDVVLEVSQGRQPCWRLNLRFDRPDMARLVQATGRTGWYFRVIEPGPLRPRTVARLIARPHPDWTIARVSTLLYHDRMTLPHLAQFAALPGLPASWRSLAQARLSTGRTEDWARRIDTPQ